MQEVDGRGQARAYPVIFIGWVADWDCIVRNLARVADGWD